MPTGSEPSAPDEAGGARRGLGRGLSAILQDTAAIADKQSRGLRSEPAHARLFRAFVETGLDQLLDPHHTYVGYVHRCDPEPPEFFLHHPAPESVDSSVMYRLISAVNTAIADPTITRVELPGSSGHLHLFPSTGERSQGVHFVAAPTSFDADMYDRRRRTIAPFTRLAHQFDAGPLSPDALPELDVRCDGTMVTATARMNGCVESATATNAELDEAVARAVIDARGSARSLTSVSSMALPDDRHAVLVTTRGPDGPHFGFSLSANDQQIVAAAAAIRATETDPSDVS